MICFFEELPGLRPGPVRAPPCALQCGQKKTVFVRSAEENQVSQQWGEQSKIRTTDLTEWVSSPGTLPRCARRGPWSPGKNQDVAPGPGSRSDFEAGASGLAVGDARFFFAQAAPAWPN